MSHFPIPRESLAATLPRRPFGFFSDGFAARSTAASRSDAARPRSGPTIRLLPRAGCWLIVFDGEDERPRRFSRFDDAHRRASSIARRRSARLLLFGSGGALLDETDHRQRVRQPAPIALDCRGLVVEHAEKGWILRPLTGAAPLATFRRKKRAVALAREVACRNGLRVQIRTRDGRLQKELDYRGA